MLQFGPPWTQEQREYYAGLQRLLDGSGAPPSRPADPLMPYREAAAQEPKKLISRRLEGWFLDLVKEMAAQQEMPYQQIIRIWMHQGLRRALLEGSVPSLGRASETHETPAGGGVMPTGAPGQL